MIKINYLFFQIKFPIDIVQICGKFQSLILGEHSFKDALHRNILGNVHDEIPNSIGLYLFFIFYYLFFIFVFYSLFFFILSFFLFTFDLILF